MIYSFSDYIPFFLIPFIGWGVKRMLVRKNDFTPLKRRTLLVGLIAFFFTETARSFYRPFIYEHRIFDFYISDTIGNSLGTVAAVFMMLTLAGKGNKQDWKLIAIIVVGLILYEFLELASGFDWRDVVATLLFGSLSFLTYLHLLKKYGPKVNINEE